MHQQSSLEEIKQEVCSLLADAKVISAQTVARLRECRNLRAESRCLRAEALEGETSDSGIQAGEFRNVPGDTDGDLPRLDPGSR